MSPPRPFAVVSAFAAAALLVACGGGDEGPSASTAAPAQPPPPAEPEPQPAAYVGRWAATPENCADGAWVFGAQRLATAGEVSCDYQAVNATPAGYQVSAQCTAQAPPKAYMFNLDLGGEPPNQTMTVSGGPWSGPITLRRCVG